MLVIKEDTVEFQYFKRYLNSTTNDLHFIPTKNCPALAKKNTACSEKE